jgi:ubiquinone/menaquinone biosynthesis C-methylase UbiE
MKTHYIGHDDVYKKLKESGKAGWDKTEEAYAERFAWMEKIFAAGNFPPEGKLLELGCGACNMGIWLAKRGYKVTGVDISPTAIEWGNELAKANSVNSKFLTGSVLDLSDFSDCCFDIVIDSKCFHCIIGNDRNLFLNEAFRVLRKGGYLLIDSMCTPVTPGSIQGFDPVTGDVTVNGIITRHIGAPEKIVEEVVQAGFSLLNNFTEESDGTGDLVVEAKKL